MSPSSAHFTGVSWELERLAAKQATAYLACSAQALCQAGCTRTGPKSLLWILDTHFFHAQCPIDRPSYTSYLVLLTLQTHDNVTSDIGPFAPFKLWHPLASWGIQEWHTIIQKRAKPGFRPKLQIKLQWNYFKILLCGNNGILLLL